MNHRILPLLLGSLLLLLGWGCNDDPTGVLRENLIGRSAVDFLILGRRP